MNKIEELKEYFKDAEKCVSAHGTSFTMGDGWLEEIDDIMGDYFVNNGYYSLYRPDINEYAQILTKKETVKDEVLVKAEVTYNQQLQQIKDLENSLNKVTEYNQALLEENVSLENAKYKWECREAKLNGVVEDQGKQIEQLVGIVEELEYMLGTPMPNPEDLNEDGGEYCGIENECPYCQIRELVSLLGDAHQEIEILMEDRQMLLKGLKKVAKKTNKLLKNTF